MNVDNKKLRLTGLWKKTTQAGETYYSGSLSPSIRFLIFKNNFKRADGDPDLIAYLAPTDGQANQSRDADPARDLGTADAPF